MSLHRKKWSKKDKEEVLLYNDQHVVSQTSREFNISTATIYNWKKKYDELGTVGLEAGSKTSLEKELAQHKRENNELKKLFTEKELTIKVKDSLLKKNTFLRQKK
jgi:putative transposase